MITLYVVLVLGGRSLGASTISMQTAKNVFLWPGRNWLRKAFETYFTVLIEVAWGKQRIMEVYLNVAEWGPGIYGAEAAAQHYFHKPAAALYHRGSPSRCGCFQIRSTGHQFAQPGAFSPAAL
jgi:monofunctional biosynthetic peptidoglycan transglycosylase